MTLIKFKNHPVDKLMYDTFPGFTGLFNDFMKDELGSRSLIKSLPAVNISENSGTFKLELAAPGMKKEDFKIEVEDGVLSITAEKKSEKLDENTKFSRREFSYESFKRSFTLPENVNSEKISAAYNDGILQLTLPALEVAKKNSVKAITVS